MLNLKTIKGDTFKSVPFQINKDGLPLDLTDAVIRMQLRKQCGGVVELELSTDLGITITDALGGEFKIDEVIIDIDGGKYYYDIEITIGLEVNTWINGTFVVTCDITR